MPIESPDNWFLRKHENGEIFGPVHFLKITEWARSAQVNPQDMLSNDGVMWTKAPMIPDLKMDWLIVVGDDLLYGPTTAEALVEFARVGEIGPDTQLINCTTGEIIIWSEAPFYEEAPPPPLIEETATAKPVFAEFVAPAKGLLRLNLQQRVRELEAALLEKRRRLVAAEETISRLETRIRELEERIRDFSGLRSS